MNQTLEPVKSSPGGSHESGPALRNALAGHALYLDIDGTILDLAPSPGGGRGAGVDGAVAAAACRQTRWGGRIRQRAHHRGDRRIYSGR